MATKEYCLNKDIIIEKVDGVVCIFNKNYNDTHILSKSIGNIVQQLNYRPVSHSQLTSLIENTSPSIAIETSQVIRMLVENHLIIATHIL